MSAHELKAIWKSDPDMRALVQIAAEQSVRERLESGQRFNNLSRQARSV